MTVFSKSTIYHAELSSWRWLQTGKADIALAEVVKKNKALNSRAGQLIDLAQRIAHGGEGVVYLILGI